MITLLQQINDEMAAVVGEARKSLVCLRNGHRDDNLDDRRSRPAIYCADSYGAGTILHPDGLIVTNAHVLGRQGPEVVLWDGRETRGRILAVDKKRDLAIVHADFSDLPVIKMGDSRNIRPGQWVAALGHPWGVAGAVTAGMVIAVGQPVEQLPYNGDLIQVGLRLRPGHSGGPMLDENGRLIGINTMISGPEVGLAIPAHAAKQFLKNNLS